MAVVCQKTKQRLLPNNGCKFHKVVGKSLSNFIEDVRLQHAQELLINTRLTLDEIAAQVGYADGLYFSRKFHDSTQQWPRMFRAQHIL